MQVELVKLQDWVKKSGARVVILVEGRDAAGKGGIIKRILERVSPRVFRLVALPALPSVKRPRFMHNVILSIYLLVEKSSSSIGVGTTAPGSNM